MVKRKKTISPIHLSHPFQGNFPTTLAFGVSPPSADIRKKFEEWGIAGHNGLDFGLPRGTDVVACDGGTVIQSGVNGDFGISVTVKHDWGISLYAHLQETNVFVGNHIKKGNIIGISGKSGAAFGPHLHFGIKLMNPDESNGYHGFIDPTPYFTATKTKKRSMSS